MKTHITARDHFTAVRITVIREIESLKGGQGAEEEGHLCIPDWHGMMQPLRKTKQWFLRIVNTES